MENPSDKGILSDGVRVSEESKVSVGESNTESVTRGDGREAVEPRNLEINDKQDGSKNRVEEMMSRNNGWGSWGVMNLVGRVLDGKFSMDKEVEDVDNSENRAEVNPVRDTNTCQGMIAEPTFSNGIEFKGTDIDKDLDNLNSGCQGEGNGLKGNQDLVSNELLPDGKLEIREVNDVKADVLIPKGREEHLITEKEGDLVSNEMVLDGKLETSEVNDVTADVLIPKGSEEHLITEKEGGLVSNEMVIDRKFETSEVNDVKADVLMPKGREEHLITEKEGEEYCVSDLVWGKVRSHPWWPGQIFDPSAASDNATKYFKKDSYLIAYFGDQTFAWNEGSKIKPFRMHFSQMEKQSNADGFCHAVGCALDEVAQRVELGLLCPCLPQEVHDKIKFQVVANAGIREESSRRAGGNNLSTAASFSPGELVQFLGSLAESPQSKTDRLQYAIKKAQLLAFNRWKRHYQLPILEEFDGVLEDDTQFAVPGTGSEGASDFPSKKRKSTVQDGSSWKRKCLTGDEEFPKIKEKYMSVLMSSSNSNLENDEKKPVKRGRKPISSSKNLETVNSIPSDSKMKNPAEIPTPDVILSKLILAAKYPMQGHDMISEIRLLRELRISTCVEKYSSTNSKQDAGYHKEKQPSNLETIDTFGFGGTEDSYWTDRIIQSYSQDQVLFVRDTPKERATAVNANVGVVLSLDNNKERDAVIVDLDTEEENPSLPMNEEVSEEYCPTALILNFTDLESIPSVTNLNEIFIRYGPLNESETQIFSKSKRAKVIFKRRADAETAFSSTGKYSIFGPSLVSYRLNYAPTPRKSCPTSKRSKKDTPLV